jgi:hypothetical protein
VASGGSVTLSITVSGAVNINWYTYGGSLVGSGSTLTLNNFTTANPNLYVARVSNNNGQLYSRPVKILVDATASPTITSVSPSALVGLPLPQTQLFKIFGVGFTASSTLTFNDGVDAPFNGRVPTFISANELDYNITVGTYQANWTVQVINGAQQSNLGTFTVAAPPPSAKGSLIVTLQPYGAVSVGAQWQVDSGSYHNSGDVVTNLTPGSHTVSCKTITGYTTPASHGVSITGGGVATDTETYSAIVVNNGSITVTISPAAAVSAGAQWNVDGGSYQNSGATVNNLSAGLHIISFKTIPGYLAPANISLSVASGTGYGYGVTYLTAYSIVASSSPSSAGATVGSGIYQAGNSESVVAIPRLNYAFVNWTENGAVVSTSPTYTFALNNNRNLIANFIFWGPTYFYATAVSQSAVGLTWNSYANSQAYLIVEKTNQNTGLFDDVATLPAGTTVWVDTNVVPSQAYSYRIRSWDGSLTYSTYSSVATRSTEPAPTPGTQSILAGGTADYWAIASDVKYVYWSSILLNAGGSLPNGNAIWKVSKTDGSLTPLVTGLANPVFAIVVRSNYLYWAESGAAYYMANPPTSGAIKMMSVNGGPTTTITSNNTMGGGDGIRGLAIDDSGIYWTETSSDYLDYAGQIRAVVGIPVDNPSLLSQTTPTVLASNLFQPIGLALDTNFIYWIESDPISSATNRGSVKRMAKSGGSPEMLATHLGEVHGIAVDSTNVYFSDWNGSVYRVPKTGGSATALGGYASSDFLALNDVYIFFTSYWGGPVSKIPKGGGANVNVTSQLTDPWGVAVDAAGVYWTDRAWQDAKVGMLSQIPPTIAVPPQNQIAPTNVNVTFNVIANGTPTLNYQWQKSGTNLVNSGSISGVANSTLTIANVQTNNAGNYTVVVSNNFGSITSSIAILIIDGQKPTNQIVLPSSGMRVSNVLYTATGKAGDNVVVSNVFYSLNNSAWSNATTTNNWTNWSTQLALTPGTNSVQAYAADTAGNNSTTNSVSFQFVVTNQLQIRITGLGTNSPNYSNAWLEIGRNYSITSAPASGFVFTNWLISTNWIGGTTINTTNLQFMMASNLTLQANFLDVTKPTISITAPPSGQHMTNALANFAGTASDNWKVNAVWYQLTNTVLTSGTWSLATTTNGYTNWTATVTLAVGTNTIKAYAVDLGGNYSATNNLSVLSSNTFKLQLAFTNAAPLKTNGLFFSLQLSTGLNGRIQISSNLTTWDTMTNFIGTNTTLNFRDPAATNSSQRYYRAVIP